MGFNKKFFTTGGIVAASPSAPAPLDPLQNFETVTYTGNGGTQKITGYIRKGAAFNGSSSKIDLPDSLDLAIGNNNFTVSFWVNTNDTSNDEIYISLINNYFFYVRKFSTNQIYIELGNSDSVDTGVSLTQNTWTHIAVTKSSSTGLILYKDGTAVATYSSKTGNIGAGAGNPNQIGIYNDSSSYAVNGKIDQVRIFNKAISGTNVATLAAETYASSTKSTTDIFSDGGGVVLYELDEDSLSSNFEKAAVFNGSSSIIGIPTSTINVANPYSISMWLNIADVTQYKGFFVNVTSSRLTNQISVVLNSGKITIYSVVSNGNTNLDAITVTPQSAIVNNTWFNLVIVADRSATNKAKVFFNSVEGSYVYQSGVASTAAYSETRFGIADGQYFNGKIDQVRIYSSALGSSDITKLYNESSQIPTANLTAHYKLDGNALDSVGSNNGTETSITYAGGVYGGTDTNVNYLGMAFQPDFVWIKSRSGGVDNNLIDSVRGNFILNTNRTIAQEGGFNGIVLNSNGFTVDATVAGTTSGEINVSGQTYVAWCWAAPTSETNTNGTLTSTIKKNVAAGFSIATYTGNNTQNATVGHGLGIEPKMVIIKRTDVANAWWIALPIFGSNQFMEFSTAGVTTDVQYQYTQTSDVFKFTSASQSAQYNASGGSYVMYSFADIASYQKIGSYTGNSGTNSITTGLKPRFVIMKNTANGYSWIMQDSTRGTSKFLYPNLSNLEVTSSTHITSFDSNGFTLGSNADVNYSGDTYIYLAIA